MQADCNIKKMYAEWRSGMDCKCVGDIKCDDPPFSIDGPNLDDVRRKARQQAWDIAYLYAEPPFNNSAKSITLQIFRRLADAGPDGLYSEELVNEFGKKAIHSALHSIRRHKLLVVSRANGHCRYSLKEPCS